MSKTEWEKRYDNLSPDTKWFFIEKKDGTKIGTIYHFLNGNYMEIGYILVPSERKKGYGSEAIRIIVDYLFLNARAFLSESRVNIILHITKREQWEKADLFGQRDHRLASCCHCMMEVC